MLRQFLIASFPRSVYAEALYLFLWRKTLVSLICCVIIAVYHFREESCLDLWLLSLLRRGWFSWWGRVVFGADPWPAGLSGVTYCLRSGTSCVSYSTNRKTFRVNFLNAYLSPRLCSHLSFLLFSYGCRFNSNVCNESSVKWLWRVFPAEWHNPWRNACSPVGAAQCC